MHLLSYNTRRPQKSHGFLIRIYASASRYYLSPTGGCKLEFSLSINLSGHRNFFALILPTQGVKRVNCKLFAED